MSSHVRVLTLLVAMLLSCCGLAVVCGVIGYTHGMHTLAFMAAEVRLLSYGVVSALLFNPQLGLCDIFWLVVDLPFISTKKQLCTSLSPVLGQLPGVHSFSVQSLSPQILFV